MTLESEKKSEVDRRARIGRGAAIAILAGLVGAGVYAIMGAGTPRWSERDMALFLLCIAAVGMFSTRIGEILIDDLRAALAHAIGMLAYAIGTLVSLIRPALALGMFVAVVLIIHRYA